MLLRYQLGYVTVSYWWLVVVIYTLFTCMYAKCYASTILLVLHLTAPFLLALISKAAFLQLSIPGQACPSGSLCSWQKFWLHHLHVPIIATTRPLHPSSKHTVTPFFLLFFFFFFSGLAAASELLLSSSHGAHVVVVLAFSIPPGASAPNAV